jgi:hypothetical protein
MIAHMKRFAIALVGSFLLASVQAEEGDSKDAEALVRAMRADVMLLEASKGAISLATSEGYYTATQFQCFEKLPASAFTAGLARILARDLTVKELSEALAFYNSPAGIKFVDFIFETISRETGGSFSASSGNADSSMSIDEMRAARDFTRTGVGKKLTDDRLLMTSPDSQVVARDVVGKQLTACGAKIPGA